jgi:hypothetical protein
MHFAVLWPVGLKILLRKGVDVNPTDDYGRAPIHIAVALGLLDSVEQLINADCALYSPKSKLTLLQIAMRLPDPSRQRIFDLVAAALTDRHLRLQHQAILLLPHVKISGLCASESEIRERSAPRLIELLGSHAFDVPEALLLGGESVYDCNCNDRGGVIKMRPQEADALWHAGFTEIDEANTQGATPLLENFFVANFDMVAWFLRKGVSIRSKHRDSPLTAIHLYTRELYTARSGSRGLTFGPRLEIATDLRCMTRLHQELGIPYDDCTCPCAPQGCSPMNFLHRHGQPYTRNDLKTWFIKVAPPESLLPQYIRNATRLLLFFYQNADHTCCRLNSKCGIKPGDRWSVPIFDFAEHNDYCKQDIPIPSTYLQAPKDTTDTVTASLDSLMTHYNDLPGRETMLLEDQPFRYVRWLFAMGYVSSDLGRECDPKNFWHRTWARVL